MRGLRVLAAVLLLAGMSPLGADDEPRARRDGEGLLVFECGAQRWEFDEGALGALFDQDLVGAVRRLEQSLTARGFRPTAATQRELGAVAAGALRPRGAASPEGPAGSPARAGAVAPADRPEGWDPTVTEAATFRLGDTAFVAVLDGLDAEQRERLRDALGARGFLLRGLQRLVPGPWAPDPRARDLEALVAGGGRLPEGYVPAGARAPEPVPPLRFLGGTVVLALVEGQPRALLSEAPEGSRARKMGLSEGDAVLELDGQAVGPAVLLEFDQNLAAGGQHRLKVRRSQGGIEHLVLESWVRTPPPR